MLGILNKYAGQSDGCRCRKTAGEESPGFIGQGCRLTAGGGNSKDSATEIYRHFCGKGGMAV